jgi:hypothetical protein
LTMTRSLAIGTRPTRSRSATAAIIALMAFTQRFVARPRALYGATPAIARQTVIKAKHQASQQDLPSKCPASNTWRGDLITLNLLRSTPSQSVQAAHAEPPAAPSGSGNGTGRQPVKASGSGRCGFLHHHRDRVSTTAVRQNAPPGPTRIGWEYPRFPAPPSSPTLPYTG